MRQFKASLWKLLSHSPVLLILTLILGVVIIFSNQLSSEQPRITKYLLTINSVFSFIFGAYIGIGVAKFKACYLWTSNHHYRLSLLVSGLVSILIITLIQALFISLQLNQLAIEIILPFSLSLSLVYYALGSSIFNRVVYLILGALWIPFATADFNLIWFYWIQLAISVFFIVLLLKDKKNNNGHVRSPIITSNICQDTVTNPHYYKFNYRLNKIVSRLIAKPNAQKNIHWVITMPHTRLALISLLYFLIIMFNALIMVQSELILIELFCNIFTLSIVLNVLMEARQLIINTKPIAHLFSPLNHRTLKKKMIHSIDRTLLINVFALLSLVSLSVLFTGLPVALDYLVLSSGVIIALGLAIYPILLRFQWLRVSWQLVISISLYGLTSYYLCKWLKSQLSSGLDLIDISGNYVIWIFIIATIALRQTTLSLLYKAPLEKFVSRQISVGT